MAALDDAWADLAGQPCLLGEEKPRNRAAERELEEGWAAARGLDREVYVFGPRMGGESAHLVIRARVVDMAEGFYYLRLEAPVWAMPGKSWVWQKVDATVPYQTYEVFDTFGDALAFIQNRHDEDTSAVERELRKAEAQLKETEKWVQRCKEALATRRKPLPWMAGMIPQRSSTSDKTGDP